ncbi:MAG TPA: hypothetical protein VFJ77_04485, partial [Gaiellaceae bacterium]|nr:hypothetical protein [Gaiellaceae bacterium]
CEELLEAARDRLEREPERRLLAALVAPAAICRIMIELIDRPPALLLAAARVCRETSLHGIAELERLSLPAPLDGGRARASLAAAAESCGALLEAAGPG